MLKELGHLSCRALDVLIESYDVTEHISLSPYQPPNCISYKVQSGVLIRFGLEFMTGIPHRWYGEWSTGITSGSLYYLPAPLWVTLRLIDGFRYCQASPLLSNFPRNNGQWPLPSPRYIFIRYCEVVTYYVYHSFLGQWQTL